jgi:preprotein translocase subunit SecA
MKKLIKEIKLEGNKLKEKSDEGLNSLIEGIVNYKKKEKTQKDPLKNLKNYEKSDNALLILWFALVQEIAFRKIGLRHFDTQLLAGLLLNEGKIVEMKTGEGKTLVSTLPASFNALDKKSVHVVTVNEYLAERDQKWMRKVYQGLGLTCGLIKSSYTNQEKKENYKQDITYLTNSELVFDYLRDSSAYNLKDILQEPLYFCLIDEIDSVLIDESRTPLILSSSKTLEKENLIKLFFAKKLVSALEKEIDFEVDEKRRDLYLTQKGYQKVKERVGLRTLYDPTNAWILQILNALKANHLFKLNKDYIILNNKIVIVDEFTGRIVKDRRWGMGLHEALEIKEKTQIGEGTQTKTSITYQNFFNLYPKLSGMTGTANTTREEFKDIYNLDVFVLDTHKPMIRKDFPDLIYQNELKKWKAVLEEAKTCFKKGQPILIGTSGIEKSEFLSDLFKSSNISHKLLNAKPENVTRESEIIAQAGKKYAVTIATSMAGRGTDIILGGNPFFEIREKLKSILLHPTASQTNNLQEILVLEKLKKGKEEKEDFKKKVKKVLEEYRNNTKELKYHIENLPYSLDECKKELKEFYDELYKDIFKEWEKENQTVKELGGLYVLGTERQETRRIDNQLRGRAGRQGDPGISRFYISLEDQLMKIFGGNNIRNFINFLMENENTPLESSFLTQNLEQAQKKVEAYHYELRKNVFQYDNVLNIQRKEFFKARREILVNPFYEEIFLRCKEASFDEEILSEGLRLLKKEQKRKKSPLRKKEKKRNFSYDYYFFKKGNQKGKKIKNFYKEIWIRMDLRVAQSNLYELGLLKNSQLNELLSIIDDSWTDHLERMEYIKETIHWKAYGQLNPLLEYNKASFKSFKLMFEKIRSSMLYSFLNKPIY